MSLDSKGYSEKNYDVTCTVLFQGNVQEPNIIYSSILRRVRPESVHVVQDVLRATNEDVIWRRRD